VALFNLDADQSREIRIAPEWLGQESPGRLLDAWRRRVVHNLHGGDAVRLSPHGVALFVLRK